MTNNIYKLNQKSLKRGHQSLLYKLQVVQIYSSKILAKFSNFPFLADFNSFDAPRAKFMNEFNL